MGLSVRGAPVLGASPIDRSSIAERVAQHVRASIASGALAPGERIAEATLAKELGVSRSPIREALGRLATEGLVQTQPYRGTFVRPLDPHRFRELVDFRIALEEFALRRLAARFDDSMMPSLRSSIDALRVCTEKGDFDGAVDADLAIHERVIALAGNAPLQRAYASLLAELRLYIGITARKYQSMAELADEHDAALRALSLRRVDQAVEVLRGHILHGLDDVLAEANPA